MTTNNQNDRLRGLILGTAVGDALGLPAEGFRPETIRRLGWSKWKHRFIFGKGMVSDDTEHTVFVAQSLICHRDNPKKFKSCLAWKFRWWFLALPAGIGLGTAKAIIKLWLFVPLQKSGVWSAGNGPAMRSAVIGAFFHTNNDRMKEFVRCSTELTHKDPKALVGALAVSHTASKAITGSEKQIPDKKSFLEALRLLSKEDDEEWLRAVDLIERGLNNNLSVSDFVSCMGLKKGVTGYIYHTVPVAIYAWLHHYGDFKSTLTAVLNCGGDTDTVGAITGALAGTTVGEQGIPEEWIRNILEWPRSISVLHNIADRLVVDSDGSTGAVRYFWPGVILRNVFMFIIVLGHVLLRLMPAGVRRLMRI